LTAASPAGDSPAGDSPTGDSRRSGVEPGRLGRAYARLVIRLRYLIIAVWVALAVGATTLISGAGANADLQGFVAADNPAIATELRSFEIFGFPLTSRTALVQHDPDGLSVYAQAEAVLRGVALTQGAYDAGPILGALPVPNALFPGAAEHGTGVLTYLFMPPSTGFAEQRDAAAAFAVQHLADPDDGYVGVTGSIPARARQAELIGHALPLMETATIVVIALIVAASFRSLVAPLVALFVAGLATVGTLQVVALLAQLLHLSVPADVEPVIVALLLGVVTDYSVFFLSALRQELTAGRSPRNAVEHATARTAPIVAVAGLTVAAGTGALLVARSALFRGLGPGLALTVLIAMVVAVTLVPAVLAVLGSTALWPSARPGQERQAPTVPAARRGLATALTRPRNAALVAALSVLGLLLAAVPLRHLQLGVSFIDSLPANSRAAQAARQARTSFAPGILSPTEVLLEGAGIGAARPELVRLTALVDAQPGVAVALGPGTLPVTDNYGVFVARSGDAARLLVVLDDPALGAHAIDSITALREHLPALLAQSGLTGVTASCAGDTVLSALIVHQTTRDLVRISLAALLANLLMLVLFLRAVLSSLLLLASSVLALTASLGLTVFVFQDLLGGDGLTFYVPFAAAMLLVSLGSDYNIFAVGRVWEAARHLPLREAVRKATPESSQAITAAALTLAASFGLLALVPLRPFRELALAMTLGILLDAVVVRTLLVPCLLTLLGDRASRTIKRRAAARGGQRLAPAGTS